jgi:hypothetical protein
VLDVEAARLCEILLAQRDVSPLLNLGSSTREFRERAKPHIEGALFGPLRAAGVTVLHCDLKQGEGVQLSGDILDGAVRERLKEMGFRCVLISNMLEHVRDRAAVIAACEEIAGPGGLVLASVPASYPYHADPLDTGYRPSGAELAAGFTRSRVLLTEELDGQTFAQRIVARGSNTWRELAATLLWTLIWPLRPRSARARLDRWRWYRRPYRVAIALVEVQSPATTAS